MSSPDLASQHVDASTDVVGDVDNVNGGSENGRAPAPRKRKASELEHIEDPLTSPIASSASPAVNNRSSSSRPVRASSLAASNENIVLLTRPVMDASASGPRPNTHSPYFFLQERSESGIVKLPSEPLWTTQRSSLERRQMDLSRKSHFNLSKVPVYYPTEEEFKSPIAYINSIAIESRRYGMAKIVPPKSQTTPRLPVDNNNFWFAPKSQLIASDKTSLLRLKIRLLQMLTLDFKEFFEKIKRQKATHNMHFELAFLQESYGIPALGTQYCDLFNLYRTVQSLGGLQVVNDMNRWCRVAFAIGIQNKKVPRVLTATLKRIYETLLEPIERSDKGFDPISVDPNTLDDMDYDDDTEHICDDKDISLADLVLEHPAATKSIATVKQKVSFNSTLRAFYNKGEKELAFQLGDAYNALFEYVKLPVIDGLPLDIWKLRKSVFLRGGNERLTREQKWIEVANDMGYGLGGTTWANYMSEAYDNVLKRYDEQGEENGHTAFLDLVSRGESGYYNESGKIFGGIASPARLSSAATQWTHESEIEGPTTNEIYAGPTYTLEQFQETADKFKQCLVEYCSEGGVMWQNMSDFEKGYWTTVKGDNVCLEVEMAQDVSSITNSSGYTFPDRSFLRSGSLSDDLWNLNVLPYLSRSLCPLITESNSNFGRPLLDVSMLFSTQCWKFEDGLSFKLDYLHKGESKTWYSVPESEFDNFYHTLKSAIGEDILATDPQVFFSSGLAISPKRLAEDGIVCNYIDQHAGEYLVTFPKSWNFNFSHGFSVSEKVNFITENNLKNARICETVFRDMKLSPPFSYERLLFNYSVASCEKERRHIISEEINRRRYLRETFDFITVAKRDENAPIPVCEVDKSLCYFSCMRNDEHVYSLDVFLRKFANQPNVSKEFSLEIGVSDDILEETFRYSEEKVDALTWKDNLESLVGAHRKPSLKALNDILCKAALVEGLDDVEVLTLRVNVEKANVWEMTVQKLISGELQEMLTVDQYNVLISLPDTICFDSPLLSNLELHKERLLQYKNDVIKVLESGNNEDYIDWVNTGRDLGVRVPEFEAVKDVSALIEWSQSVKDIAHADKSTIYLGKLQELLKIGMSLGVENDSDMLRSLKFQIKLGILMDSRIKKQFFGSEAVDDDTLTVLLERTKTYSITEGLSRKLYQEYFRRLAHKSQIQQFRYEFTLPVLNDRPKYSDVLAFLGDSKDDAISSTCERALSVVDDWIRRGRKLFRKAGPAVSLGVLLSVAIKRTEQCFEADDTLDEAEKQRNHNKTMNESEGSNYVSQHLCICRDADEGVLVLCNNCEEWYHLRCLGISRKDIPEDQSPFICPVCDLSKPVYRDRNRPVIEALVSLYNESSNLPAIPEDIELLERIVTLGRNIQETLKPICKLADEIAGGKKLDTAQKKIAVNKLRHYAKKLEGSAVLFERESIAVRTALYTLAPYSAEHPLIVSSARVKKEDELVSDKNKNGGLLKRLK